MTESPECGRLDCGKCHATLCACACHIQPLDDREAETFWNGYFWDCPETDSRLQMVLRIGVMAAHQDGRRCGYAQARREASEMLTACLKEIEEEDRNEPLATAWGDVPALETLEEVSMRG